MSDPTIPEEPMYIVQSALSYSSNESELQENLETILANEGFDADALVEYASVLSQIQSEQISLEQFSGGFTSGQEIDEYEDY